MPGKVMVTAADLELLRKYDTPTVCNVVELFDVRPRTAGYMDARIKACYPALPPMVGFASTATFRSATPPRGGNVYAGIGEQVSAFLALPSPAVVVFQDLDDPVAAATFGEIMCTTYKTFGAVGLITSGGGRDLDQVEALKFPCFTSGTICAHGYCQIVQVGVPVHVGGVMVHDGDLLHGDRNGVTTIPLEVAAATAKACADYMAAEQVVLDYLRSGKVDPQGFTKARNECKDRLAALEKRLKSGLVRGYTMKKKSVNRRQFFLSSGAALAPLAAEAEDVPTARKPAFIIDCQSHLFAPELLELMEKRKKPPHIYEKQGVKYLVVNKWHRRLIAPGVKEKLAAMDEAGIGLAAISTNDPGPEQFGKDGPAVVRIVHDYLADTVKQHPNRFFALAALPLQDMDAALVELDRCVNKLGMKGILLYSNIAGKFPDEPQFAPLFKRAEDMGIPVLLHPPYPVTFDATEGFNLTGGLGLMFDTTIALCRIILSGLLDRHPKLKLVCPHVGGTLPYLIGRIDHQVTVLKRVAVDIRKKPSEYLRNIYLDAVNALPAVIRFGCDFVGPDRMLYSSDHPWVDPKLILDNVNSLNLPAEHAEKLFSGNARRLFNL